MSLAGLFPDQDYQFHLRFERGEPAQYFQSTAHHNALIADRARWFRADPDKYSALLPEAVPLLNEVIDLARTWNGFPSPPNNTTASERLLALGEFWEPDFLLLRADHDQEVRL